MPRIFAFFLCFACLPLLVGCDPHDFFFEQPAAGLGVDYLEVRDDFATNLTYQGPSPQEWEVETLGKNVRAVKYPSLNRSLQAWVYVPDNDESRRRPALIYCHGGFAGGAESVFSPEAFLNGDYVIMAPTWRGENGNPGNFEMMFGEVDDAVSAARWLARQPYVDSGNIYMFGHSVGGGISALVSLLDDVPLRHTGSSGGLYPPMIFRGWSDITPFDYNDPKECALRVLDGNTGSMRRKHYAYLGKEDYNAVFGFAAKKYVTGKVEAPQLVINVIPGDHFTSFDEAVRKYFDVVEADRKGSSPRQSFPSRETTVEAVAPAKYDLTRTYANTRYGFRIGHDPTWIRIVESNSVEFQIHDANGNAVAGLIITVGPQRPNLMNTTRGQIEQELRKIGHNAKLIDFDRTDIGGVESVYYTASATPDNRTLSRYAIYTLNHKSHCYVITCFTVDGRYAEYKPLFEAVLESFQLP